MNKENISQSVSPERGDFYVRNRDHSDSDWNRNHLRVMGIAEMLITTKLSQ